MWASACYCQHCLNITENCLFFFYYVLINALLCFDVCYAPISWNKYVSRVSQHGTGSWSGWTAGVQSPGHTSAKSTLVKKRVFQLVKQSQNLMYRIHSPKVRDRSGFWLYVDKKSVCEILMTFNLKDLCVWSLTCAVAVCDTVDINILSHSLFCRKSSLYSPGISYSGNTH